MKRSQGDRERERGIEEEVKKKVNILMEEGGGERGESGGWGGPTPS